MRWCASLLHLKHRLNCDQYETRNRLFGTFIPEFIGLNDDQFKYEHRDFYTGNDFSMLSEDFGTIGAHTARSVLIGMIRPGADS